MSGQTPTPIEGWVVLTCPGCRTRMRIRPQYAHLRGRCPECGTRLEPAVPPPRPPIAASDANEPLGLVPIDEEWPEPPRLERPEEPEGPYRLSQDPALWSGSSTAGMGQSQPRPAVVPSVEGYGVAEGYAPPAATTAGLPAAEPYVAAPVAAAPPLAPPEPIPDYLREAPLERTRPPAPPGIFRGVFDFPWRPGNLSIWLLMGLNFTIVALFAALAFLFIAYGGIFLVFVPPILVGMTIVIFWAGGDACDKFLVTLEATAGGAEQIHWGARAGVFEAMGRLFYLGWVAATSGLPPFLVSILAFDGLPSWPVGWLTGAAVWTAIFPLMLYSSLAADSHWIVVEPRTILAALRHPLAYGVLWLVALSMLGTCTALAFSAMVDSLFVLAPVLGGWTAACVLIYARLLGRVAWIITGGDYRERRRRQRKKIEVGGPVLPAPVEPPLQDG